MLDETMIDQDYNQPDGTYYCGLASYGICNKYFTARPVIDGFHAYCRHYNQSADSSNVEATFVKHFNPGTGENIFVRMVDLHNNSLDEYFVQARSKFSVERIVFVSHAQTDNFLSDIKANRDWMACLSLECLSGGCHIVCCYFTMSGIRSIRDPMKSIKHYFLPYIRECLLVRPVP